MTNVTFSLDLLQDTNRLRETFFTGEKELEQIRKCPVPEKPAHVLQTWRWTVEYYAGLFLCPIILVICSIALTVAYCARFLGVYWLSTRCFLISERFFHHSNFENFENFGKDLIVPTYNNHQWETSDVYNRPPIKVQNIPNPELRASINPEFTKIIFNKTQKGGLCHGACLWFIYLYNKLKRSDWNPKKPLWEYAYPVAKQFEYGQPKQSALLQSLYGSAPLLCPFKLVYSYSIDLENPRWDALHNWIYYLRTKTHAIVYMQRDNEKWIWDPNFGLIQIRSFKHLALFLKNNYTIAKNEITLQALF